MCVLDLIRMANLYELLPLRKRTRKGLVLPRASANIACLIALPGYERVALRRAGRGLQAIEHACTWTKRAYSPCVMFNEVCTMLFLLLCAVLLALSF